MSTAASCCKWVKRLISLHMVFAGFVPNLSLQAAKTVVAIVQACSTHKLGDGENDVTSVCIPKLVCSLCVHNFHHSFWLAEHLADLLCMQPGTPKGGSTGCSTPRQVQNTHLCSLGVVELLLHKVDRAAT